MSDEKTLDDDEMKTSKPTEASDDKDTGGDGAANTGDMPTEADDDKDAGGEGTADTGDES